MNSLISYWDFNEGVYELVEDVTGSGQWSIMEQHGADVPNGCNDPLAENLMKVQTLMMEVVNILIMEIIS